MPADESSTQPAAKLIAATSPLPPWDWPEAQWRASINRARAGRSLSPVNWPNRNRCAVAFSFDSDHESNELRDGGVSIGRLSWGQFGHRAGIPRIRQVLAAHGVPASFYVPAVIAQIYPDEQRALIDDGHEIGIHGWIHELNSVLEAHEERDLMLRAADVLEKITRKRPVGMRTPSWDFSDATLSIAKEMELLYDSSLMADDDCYELLLDGKPSGVVEVPVEWMRDDAVYFMMNKSPAIRPHLDPMSVFDIFRREFEAAYEEGGLFQLTMHPHVIGYRSRIWILEELIRLAKAKGDVWFATHAQVAEWVSLGS